MRCDAHGVACIEGAVLQTYGAGELHCHERGRGGVDYQACKGITTTQVSRQVGVQVVVNGQAGVRTR